MLGAVVWPGQSSAFFLTLGYNTHKTLVPLSKGYKGGDLWAIAKVTEKPQTNYFLMLWGKVAFNSFAIAAHWWNSFLGLYDNKKGEKKQYPRAGWLLSAQPYVSLRKQKKWISLSCWQIPSSQTDLGNQWVETNPKLALRNISHAAKSISQSTNI